MSVLELHPFLMCIDLRDISCPYKDRLRLRTSAHPLNQPHPLLSWLVFPAYCCLLTILGNPHASVRKTNRLKTPPPPRTKNKLGCTSTACNIWMHLALESYVLGMEQYPQARRCAFFFGAYRPRKTRRCNEPICATASYLEPGVQPRNVIKCFLQLLQKWRNGQDNFQLPRY